MSTSLPGSFRSCYNDDDIDFQSLHEEDTDGASGNTRANHADQLYNPAPQEPPIHEQPPPQTYRQPDVPLFRNDPENSDVCCPHVALSCIPRDRPREIILLTVLTVLSMFGLRVAFVEYYHAVTLEKTDLYCALLFCFFCTWLIFVIIAAVWKSLCSGNIALLPKSKKVYLAGITYGIFFVLYILSMGTDRTPQYMQYIITLTLIPFVIIIRKWRFTEAFNHNELSYSAISLSALFITSLPHILGVVPTDSPDLGDQTIAYQVLWPLCFAASFATLVFYLVRLEKELKKDEVHPIQVIAWIDFIKLVTAVVLFWMNILPHFGLAPDDLSAHFRTMLECHFNLDPLHDCSRVAWLVWIFIVCYCSVVLCYSLLLYMTKSALYTMMTIVISAPLTQLLWWSLISHNDLSWDPAFTAAQGFAIPGLMGTVLATAFYWRLVKQDNAYRRLVEDVMSNGGQSSMDGLPADNRVYENA